MHTRVTDAWRLATTLGRGFEDHGNRTRNRRWQDRQVASLVAYAAAHVPYYRRLFAAHGIDSASIRTVDDLSRIPVTTKATLKALPLRDRVSDEFEPESLIRHATSGSSGIPFQIRRTWFDERRLNVFWIRQIMRQGVRPWHRVVTLAGARAGQSGDRAVIQKTLAGVGLFRNTKLNSLQPVDETLAALARLQPDHLMGFAWALLRVGDAHVASGRRSFRPLGVHTFGEVLTPSMRQRLHEAFQCPVLDLYGSHELGMAAFECRTQPYYHVLDDAVVLEVLRDGNPVSEGEAGVVTGTNLLAYAMPFIRFEMGDIATRGPATCPCGWEGTTIAELEGRMLDVFPLPDGRLLHPYTLVYLLLDHMGSEVFQYQLVQESTHEVVLRVVPMAGAELTGCGRFTAEAARLLGGDVRLVVERVLAIDVEQSGKFRVSRSKVASEYDDTAHGH